MTDIGFLYIISLIIAFTVLVFALTFMANKDNGSFLVLLFDIVIVVFGYYKLSTAQTLEEAIFAKQVTYFDGTFTSFMMLSCIMRICKFKMPKWFLLFSILYSGLVFALPLTIGRNDIYFKNVSFKMVNGVGVLIKENGPGHIFFTVGLIFYMLLITIVTVRAFFMRYEISYIHSIILAILVLVDMLTYFLERAFHVETELLPFAYNLTEICLVLIMVRTNRYEISNDILSAIERLGEHGYVVFDKNKRFIGKDETAKHFFPEVLNLEIDRAVRDPFILDEFIALADELDAGTMQPRYYEREGRTLKCSAQRFTYGYVHKNDGYLIEISDDTKHQKHIQILNQYNDDLKEAVAAAEVANEAKSNFLSKMSHEIRTPINAINGMTEMILRETKQTEILEYANDVKSSSNMLLALVNDVLDFSKIEAGKMELNIVPYRLGNIIHDIDIMMRQRATDKGLIFKVEVDPNTPCELVGDDMRIKQIIVNLVSNAVKYTDKGAVTFSVGFENKADNGILLIVSIKDTGRGIKKENIATLFDSFIRLDEDKNVGIEGTGLGLSITKQFTELMGGTISVESTYGEGSVFVATIPQHVNSIETIGTYSNKQARALHDYTESLVLPGLKILVVDDTKMNLKVFSSLLKKTEIDIDTATSGVEAIEKCHNNKYHMMPEMDGIECFEHLNNDEQNLNRGVPVVMLTANAISGMREMYLEKGFTDYIAKPFQMAELSRVISENVPESYSKEGVKS